MLDSLIDQLPEHVCAQVSQEIREEDRQQKKEAEVARHFSVFRITQDGETDCLLTEGDASMDAFHTAMRLRSYLLAKGNSSQRFSQSISTAEHIAPEVFQDYAGEVRQHTGLVVAALDIDLDRGKFSALSALNGWENYTVRDVCTAVWHADRKNGLHWTKRLDIFAAQLEGKETTPEHRLDVSQVTFADEIMEMDGLLNFYSARFSPRKSPGGTGPQGQRRRFDRGSPEGLIFVQDKGRGSQAPLRPCHTAPQRGSVQGLPGFRATPVRGVTFGPRGSHRGSAYQKTRTASPFQRGSQWGLPPNIPLLRGVECLHRSQPKTN